MLKFIPFYPIVFPNFLKKQYKKNIKPDYYVWKQKQNIKSQDDLLFRFFILLITNGHLVTVMFF